MDNVDEKKITIKLITHLLGTIPKDKEIYATFIATKNPNEINSEEVQTVQEAEEKGWTGFHIDEKGIFLFDYLIKGFFKNAGNVLKDSLKVKALRSKITDYLFVTPRKIYIAQKIDGCIERPLRAQTMQGQRVTLARSDYIKEGTVIEFTIKLLKHKELNWELVNELLKYGELQGLGQFRGGGYGRFEVIH